MIKIGDRVSFVSMLPALSPGGKPTRYHGVVEDEDGPNKVIVLTDHGARHSVSRGMVDKETDDA